MKRSILSGTALAVMALAIAVAAISQARPSSADDKASGQNNEVKIDNFSFVPPTLTVAAGTTVTWVNHDDIPHNIVGLEAKALKSQVLDTDQKFSYTFREPGTYNYYCGIHPKMTGKIVVR